MHRLFLTYRGHSMELRPGETVIGRGLSCQMRLNDPSVSRAHVRVWVGDGEATLEDLGSHNGTRVNGQRVTKKIALSDGDMISLGNRFLEVRIEDADEPFETSTVSNLTVPELPREEPPKPRRAAASAGQRCPECRRPVSIEDDSCPSCGYSWADFRPGAVTRRVSSSTSDDPAERRRHARHEVEVPVLYSSENLTVESMAINLSRGGVFVRTQILDEIGTDCELTLMADGAPALTFRGTVKRVVERAGEDPLGLGIEFRDLDPTARRWLDDTLARIGSPS